MAQNHQTPAGALGYLQLPARDAGASAAFYRQVFGWQVDLRWNSFDLPGLMGQWVSDRAPADPTAGPVLWLAATDLQQVLAAIPAAGGRVVGEPVSDEGARWLVEFDDPAGNRLGVYVPVPGRADS